jgi:hypothetical protein
MALLVLATMVTDGVTMGSISTVMVFEDAAGQAALEVRETPTILPVVSVEEVKAVLLVPVLVPFTVH